MILLPSEIRRLYPFHHHFLELDGPRMHYVDEGSGPPIVFLHGNPTWSFYFRDLIVGLRDQYRVIAPDHIGCGLSDKPRNYPYTLSTHITNVEKLLNHLGLENVTLAVHDWGGAIGFGWAVRHPQKVSRLVIFNTAAFLGGKTPFRIRICRWPILGEIALLGFNAFPRAAITMACHPSNRMTPDVRAGYLHPYRKITDRVAILGFVRDIPLHSRIPSHAVLKEIESNLLQFRDRPMTIFWGERDFCFTTKFLDEWTARFPTAEVHRFPDAAHYVVEDAHDRILPLLQNSLARYT
ncbi:MAG: alpha/beta fold hydrolase [Planctomycetota bacterium]